MRLPTKLITAIAACGILGASSGGVLAAPDPHYVYVPLDSAVPAGFSFFDPAAVIDDGRVYGNAFRCSAGGCVSWMAVRDGRAITVLRKGRVGDANNRGVVSGSILTSADPRNGLTQAVLLRGRNLQLIPRLPGEISSSAGRLTDSGIALVFSRSADAFSLYLRRPNGAVTPLDFGASDAFFVDINGQGVASGTTFPSAIGAYRALRLRPPASLTLLDPLPTEHDAWGLGINARNDVLGYSFVFGSTERIGFWHGSTFHTRFVEGTPEFPTVSNFLLWNEPGLIVITNTSDSSSYLVPRANVRLNLADLADRLPPWTNIIDVNNEGDLIGFGGATPGQIDESFLLKHQPASAARAGHVAWHPASQAARAARQAAVAQGLLTKETLATYRPVLRKDRAR